MEMIITLLSSAAVSGSTAAILIFLARTWMSERIKQSIKHEYDVLLEQYKHELKAEHEIALERLRASNAENQAIQAVAMASFAEGHKAAHERRLAAIEMVWKEIVRLRKATPAATTLVDILVPQERQQFVTNPRLRELVDSFSIEQMEKLFLSDTAENARPFVGEFIYALFFAYRALSGRVAFFIKNGVEKGKVDNWFEDPGIRRLISAALTPEEIKQFDETKVRMFMWLRNLIEQKILGQANRIISGEEAGHLGLEQAQRIVDAARELLEKHSGG